MNRLLTLSTPATESVCARTLLELHELDDGGAPEIFLELTSLFAKSTSKLISQAQHCLDDPNRLATIAHTIKGSAGNFGAHRLQSLCTQLEQFLGQGDKQATKEIIVAMESEFRNVCAALERDCPNTETKGSPALDSSPL